MVGIGERRGLAASAVVVGALGLGLLASRCAASTADRRDHAWVLDRDAGCWVELDERLFVVDRVPLADEAGRFSDSGGAPTDRALDRDWPLDREWPRELGPAPERWVAVGDDRWLALWPGGVCRVRRRHGALEVGPCQGGFERLVDARLGGPPPTRGGPVSRAAGSGSPR